MSAKFKILPCENCGSTGVIDVSDIDMPCTAECPRCGRWDILSNRIVEIEEK